MRKSIRVVVSIAAVAAAIAAFAPAAMAGVIDSAQASAKSVPPGGTWLAWGGQTRFHFNPDELNRLDVRIASVDGAASRTEGKAGVRYEVTAFRALDASGLEINHTGRVISGISLVRSPSKRAAHKRRVSQSPKMYAPWSSGNFLP